MPFSMNGGNVIVILCSCLVKFTGLMYVEKQN